MKDIINNGIDTQNTSDEINNSINKDELNKGSNIKDINPQIENNSINLEIYEEKKKEYFEEYLTTKNNNPVISYYYNTLTHLQKSNEFLYIYSLLVNSKNYIQKSNNIYIDRNNFKGKYNDKYINNYTQISNCIYDLNNNFLCKNKQQNNIVKLYNYNNNVCLSHRLSGTINNKVNNKDKISTCIINNETKDNKDNTLKENSDNSSCLSTLVNDIDCPPFIPSNYNNNNNNATKEIIRKDSNDSSSKDKESDSTSAISEKREEENNFSTFNKIEKNKNKEKMVEDEYLVEMFGRKGWICRLCNNFNYETRNKCNRCGIVKKPKKILDLKQKVDHKANNNNNDVKERNNKKGDWICINCRNLNYSFRTICNRCKIPKINTFLNSQNIIKKKEINNLQKFPICSFPPYFIFFNNVE